MKLKISGAEYTLDPWELMQFIVTQVAIKCEPLYAKCEANGKTFAGKLIPHSIDRTQKELTRSLLVEIIREHEKTLVTHCKNITHINYEPL